MMRRAIQFAFAFVACLMILAICGSGRAQEAQAPIESEDAIESGRQALNGFPWYDAKNDSLRRVELRAPTDPAGPTNWQPPPTTTPTGPNVDWSWLAAIMQVVPWLLLIVLLIVVLYFFAKYYIRTAPVAAEKSKKGATTTKKSEVERLKSLPFDVDRPVDDLLAETQRQYEAGNFSAAIIYLYSFLLVELDRHHRIRLEKGKTNRQYLREIRPRPELRPAFEETMIAFEEVFFGHHEIDRARFESCWQLVPQFRAVLAK